jgi:hypothetical protein
MKDKVYVETSIPSFFYEDRTDIAATARREWTHRWWNTKSSDYDLITSVAVLNELEIGDYPKKEQCVELLNGLPLMTIEPDIVDIVQVYIEHRLMPRDPAGEGVLGDC